VKIDYGYKYSAPLFCVICEHLAVSAVCQRYGYFEGSHCHCCWWNVICCSKCVGTFVL